MPELLSLAVLLSALRRPLRLSTHTLTALEEALVDPAGTPVAATTLTQQSASALTANGGGDEGTMLAAGAAMAAAPGEQHVASNSALSSKKAKQAEHTMLDQVVCRLLQPLSTELRFGEAKDMTVWHPELVKQVSCMCHCLCVCVE